MPALADRVLRHTHMHSNSSCWSQVVDVELGSSDADVGPPTAQSAPADSGAAASAVAAAAAVADAAQAGGSVPGHGRSGRSIAAIAAAVAAANNGAPEQQHRHATTLRASGGGGGSSRIGPGPSSYAAAAAAGTGPGAEPKLRFSLNGRRLPHSFTILQAVQQAKADAATADGAAASAAAAASSAGSGATGGSNALALDAAQAARRARRLWDEVRCVSAVTQAPLMLAASNHADMNAFSGLSDTLRLSVNPVCCAKPPG